VGDVEESSRLIGCIFASSQAIFLIIRVLGNSLMVKNCLALTVDGGGAVISSKMLMFD
jgi:hypothetical protein